MHCHILPPNNRLLILVSYYMYHTMSGEFSGWSGKIQGIFLYPDGGGNHLLLYFSGPFLCQNNSGYSGVESITNMHESGVLLKFPGTSPVH